MAEWYKIAPKDPSTSMIVDLSAYADQLANYEDISTVMTSTEEDKIVQYIGQLVKLSHDEISKRYSHWREADRAHDVYVPPDATKFREKAVIGQTRAIADTVITYLMAAMTGRNPMFQLEGLDKNSRKASPIIERILHAQMRRTAGEARILQIFMDSVRYGVSPTKISWDGSRNTNAITNFNPRRYFPDPRVNWGSHDRAGFVVVSEPTTYDHLYTTGEYPKVMKYRGLRDQAVRGGKGWIGNRFVEEKGRAFRIDQSSPKRGEMGLFKIGRARIHDEAWIRIPGDLIGVPQFGMMWLVVSVLDESVCIKFRLSPVGKQFPILPGGLFYDAHKTFSQSLYDLLLPMHDIMNWLLRSRIDNVQSSLTNLIFADPTQVNIMDLIERNPWGIVTAMPGFNAQEGVKIVQIPDVTRGHWDDISRLADMEQRVSAASDAQQGMPTGDVRTATEIQRLTQLGSQRLGVISRVMSSTTLRPAVHMMVSNIQDSLDFEDSVNVGSASVPESIRGMVEDGYISATSRDVQGKINYLVVDGTLPLEPTRSPETWMKMIQVVGQTGLSMEVDQKGMAMEAIKSMGVPDVDRFVLSEEAMANPSPSQQFQLSEQQRGMAVQGDEQIDRDVQAGNLVPLSEMS